METLPLHEEVLLLALRDEEGTTISGAWYQQAIAGALVAELLLAGHLEVRPEGKKEFLFAVGDGPGGGDLLAECWAQVRDAKRPRTARDWVSRLAGTRRLKHRVAAPLVERGILAEDERKLLFLFPQTVYPEADGRPEDAILRRLERAVFSDSAEVDPRTTVLLALADATRLLQRSFGAKALKPRRQRIEAVVNGDLAGAATREAVAAAQTAVMVAAIMPAMIAATTAAH